VRIGVQKQNNSKVYGLKERGFKLFDGGLYDFDLAFCKS